MMNQPIHEGEITPGREVDIGKSFFEVFSLHTWQIPRRPDKDIISAKDIDPRLLGYYVLYGSLAEWLTLSNMDDAPQRWEELLDQNLFPYFLHLDSYELPDIQNPDLRVLRDFVIQRLKPDVRITLRRSNDAVSTILNNQ